MATQGMWFHLSAWAVAARFSTCPSCRAHTGFMSNSFIPGVKFVACHCGRPSAGNAKYGYSTIWIIQGKLVWVMPWLPSATCSVLCLVFEEWLVAVHCAADVERLPLSAGFQGRQVIFLSLLSLKLHWLLWWAWEWRQIFLIISCLTFLVLLPSSLKLGRWQLMYDSRGCCSRVVFQHVLLMGSALFGTLSFYHRSLCVAADHCSCFTVVSNAWFRKVRDICGFHSSSLAEVIQSDWCVREDCLASLELLNCHCCWQPIVLYWLLDSLISLWESMACYIAVEFT